MFRKYRLVSLIGVALFCALAFFGLSATSAMAATYTPTVSTTRNAPPPPNRRTPPPPPNRSCQPNLMPGNQGASVRELQMLLNRSGFRGPNGRPLAITGRFDNETLFAVKQFEARHHLPQNGRVDARHWQFLGQCGR
jgi:peptidoglycan hydrolase-like protein with peptidoglycan-binding domain